MKIYTKGGDKGSTSLFGGRRLPKHHLRIECYGTIDELNSFVGLLADQCDQDLKDKLRKIQSELFCIGAILASDPEKELSVPIPEDSSIEFMENWMDEISEIVAPLRNFVIPGGHQVVSSCHICRTVCRRSERLLVALSETEEVPPILLRYINRLSDLFFMLGRERAFALGVDEIQWIAPKK